MAEDVRGLVKALQAFRDAVVRLNRAYHGIVFAKQVTVRNQTRVVESKAEAIEANLVRLRTKQQACLRSSAQDCSRDKLWAERMTVADIEKVAPTVDIDETRMISDDKTVAVIVVKCREGGCWSMRTGGDGGRIIEGRPAEQIHCRIGDGCRQMKRDLEQLIALANAPDTLAGKAGAGDRLAAPGQLPPVLLRVTAKLEPDGTIEIRYRHDGLMGLLESHANNSGGETVLRYPPSHPSYKIIMDNIEAEGIEAKGKLRPGEVRSYRSTVTLPAWKPPG
jgi:hypothetical protein